MNGIFRGSIVILAMLVPCSSFGDAQDEAKNAHGIFTGEIKSVIYVSDVEKSAPFYRDVLGFDFANFANWEDEPYYAEMFAAGVKFGLHEPMSTAQEAKVGQQLLYFRVKNLKAHRSRVLAWEKEAGDIKKTDWMDLFIVRDPDGNEVVFALTDSEHHPINPWNTIQPAEKEEEKAP